MALFLFSPLTYRSRFITASKRAVASLFASPFKLLGGISLALLVSACNAPGDVCIYGDSTNKQEKAFDVLANNSKWVSTNIIVDKDSSLEISADGKVSMCSTQTPPVLDRDIPEVITVTVNANNHAWTDPGITLQKGDYFKVIVGDPNSSSDAKGNKWSTWNGSTTDMPAPPAWMEWTNPFVKNQNPFCTDENTSPTTSNPCWYVKGQGLRGYIGDPYPVPYDPTYIGSTYTKPDPNNAPGVFSLANPLQTFPGTSNYAGGIEGTSNVTGKLYFRIKDCNNPGQTCYGDNIGGYTLEVYAWGCGGKDGVGTSSDIGNLEAVIVSFGDPNVPNNMASKVPGYQYEELTLKNGKFTGKSPASGTVWLRIKDNDTEYKDNAGSYNVTVKTDTLKQKLSSLLMTYLIDPVQSTLKDAVKTIFNNMIQDTGFIQAIRALLILYVIIYCIMFIFGMVPLSQLDLVIRLTKIAVILALISPKSWDFFDTHLFILFREGGAYLIGSVSNSYSNAFGESVASSSNPFQFIDKTIGFFLDTSTIKKLLALIVIFPIGWIYLVLIFMALVNHIMGVAKAIVGYLLSLVIIAALLTVAPIFLSFLLFSYTKQYFDTWINMLWRYTLEPLLMITILVLINEFVMIALYGVLNFAACWRCAFPFSIPIDSENSINILCLNFFVPWGYDPEEGKGFDFFEQFPRMFVSIVMLLIFSNLSKHTKVFVSRLAASFSSTSAVTDSNIFGAAPNASGIAEMATSYEHQMPDGKYASRGLVGRLKHLTGMDTQRRVDRNNADNQRTAERYANLAQKAGAEKFAKGEGQAMPTPTDPKIEGLKKHAQHTTQHTLRPGPKAFNTTNQPVAPDSPVVDGGEGGEGGE